LPGAGVIAFQADVLSTQVAGDESAQVACDFRRAHEVGYALWFSKTKKGKSKIAQLNSQN
jgi:hypothetical protein